MQKILDDNKVSSQLGLEEVNQEQFVISMKTFILSFVDLYAEWLKEDEDQILKRKTDDSQIIRTVQLLEVLASFRRKKFSGRKKKHEEK